MAHHVGHRDFDMAVHLGRLQQDGSRVGKSLMLFMKLCVLALGIRIVGGTEPLEVGLPVSKFLLPNGRSFEE
jgi:hypothetical protein